MHFWEIDEITLSDSFWGGNPHVTLHEGIAVRHVSLNGTRLDCAVYHAIEAVKVDDDVLFEASLPDGGLAVVPALAHLVELDSDKRPHELDCQSQSGVKIGAPSGLFGTPLFQRIEDNAIAVSFVS